MYKMEKGKVKKYKNIYIKKEEYGIKAKLESGKM